MTRSPEQRIWFHPPQFWAATNRMSKKDADDLFDRILQMAQNSELDRLRQYPFISIEPPVSIVKGATH